MEVYPLEIHMSSEVVADVDAEVAEEEGAASGRLGAGGEGGGQNDEDIAVGDPEKSTSNHPLPPSDLMSLHVLYPTQSLILALLHLIPNRC